MSKYYTCPCLLIEFDPAKSFCLQNPNDLGMDIKIDSVGSRKIEQLSGVTCRARPNYPVFDLTEFLTPIFFPLAKDLLQNGDPYGSLSKTSHSLVEEPPRDPETLQGIKGEPRGSGCCESGRRWEKRLPRIAAQVGQDRRRG